MAGSTRLASKPMSTKEISDKAQDFDFNPFISMKFWLRTADTLLREANIYEHEANDQQAYLLYMRYAALVSEKFPLHPEAKALEYRPGVKLARKNLPAIIETLEVLKPRINNRYKTWEEAVERRRDINGPRGSTSKSTSQRDLAAWDPAVAGNSTTLAAAENSQLAVELAHREFRRRDAARRASRQAGVTEKEEQERRTAGLWDDWEAALTRDDRPSQDDNNMRSDMEAARQRTDGTYDCVPASARGRFSDSRPMQHRISVPEYRYPSIQKSQSYSVPLNYDNDIQHGSSSSNPPQVPPKPPKPSSVGDAPLRPAKTLVEAESPATVESVASKSYTFAPSAYLESGKPLRTVILPSTLRKEFLAHAESNTRKNLETCGMLCGSLISNALFVRQVVIPEQNSTSDTCETTNEGAFFDYCDKEDLLVLGWIHTHPSQTCFMSSRDLHTHAGYQVMMPESIAIVCAPSKDPSWGVFRLTDPPGMSSVLNCRQTGLFHPHAEMNIYTGAMRPEHGHVMEAVGMELEVVDLRPH